MSIKKVTFSAETKEPHVAERCLCCGHRNIIPQIREMDLCMECFKQTCSECLTGLGLCNDCYSDLMHVQSNILNIPDYESYSDD